MKQQLKVAKMVCFGCVNTITKAIKIAASTATVQAEPKTKLVSIETQASEPVIKEAIAAVGYPST